MPGDTFTPSRNYDETLIENDHVVNLHMGRKNLIPQSQIQAKREVQEALIAALPEQERKLSPVEERQLLLSDLTQIRLEEAA